MIDPCLRNNIQTLATVATIITETHFDIDFILLIIHGARGCLRRLR